MINARIGTQSPLSIRWPRRDEDIIVQAETWVLYETSRNASHQLKDTWLLLIQKQLDDAKIARTLVQTGEAARTVASADYQTAIATARTLLERALAFLKFKHADHLVQLEHWGWNVRHTQRGGYTVKMPIKDAELIRLLDTYLTYEATRGPAQITDPPLPTLQALQTDIQDLAQNRSSSRAQRTTNVYVRGTATDKLKGLLEGAAIALSLLEFEGETHPSLANWGYHLVATALSPAEEENGNEGPSASV
jgi:hypothetical protein